MTIQEKILVMQAFADGKDIEFKSKHQDWKEANPPNWNWVDCKYRVAIPKWEPSGGDWYLNGNGTSSRGTYDTSYRLFGMEFNTEEAANKASKAYRTYHRLYKLAEELNEGWEPDWECYDTAKYIIYFDPRDGNYYIDKYVYHRFIGGVHFKSYGVAQQAIEILKQE